MTPLTDIVIPVHGAFEYVKKTVHQLYEATNNFRLIVVDDFSDTETREFLYGPECTGRDRRNIYVRSNRQLWFTRASNTGLRLVETPQAVLLNSDMELSPGWLEELYGCWEEFEQTTSRRVGLVGHTQDMASPNRYEETREPNYVTGHTLLLSMQALQEASVDRGDPGRYLDELDQKAAHINSDRFLCYQLNKLGWATVKSFKAQCGHHGFKSWNADLGTVFSLKLEDLD
jgi:glycosyltransferase involved in cell wall biosynthesis